jgi:ubiquinone/menaquinone biosynthesis C-methylase UbiE
MNSRRSLAGLRRDWTRLGQADPLWAVCVDRAKQGGRWDIAEFLASGRAEIADALADLDRLGMCARRDDALDFGCGVGRLTVALTAYFGSVTGVDISPSMLGHARKLHAASPRCRFVLNDRLDLQAFPSSCFDLVYSSLVLQHMPTALAGGYLAEFVRVVRPGGAVVILVPEAHLRTLRGSVYAYAPHRLIGLIQRMAYGYPAPMRMHTLPGSRVRNLVEPHGARVVASIPKVAYGGHWRMMEHFIVSESAQGRRQDGGSTVNPGSSYAVDRPSRISQP